MKFTLATVVAALATLAAAHNEPCIRQCPGQIDVYPLKGMHVENYVLYCKYYVSSRVDPEPTCLIWSRF